MEVKGKISIVELKGQVEAQEIETIIVGFTDHYGRLVFRICF